MVDITYLGFDGAGADTGADLPFSARLALLDAPFYPLDGMNERGLAVGLAAVPTGHVSADPEKPTLGSLVIIREILDHAASVDEAVAIMRNHNINMTGGPDVHYLVADASGHAVLIEYYEGEMVVIPNEASWHLATNFLRASVGGSAAGKCWRYDKMDQRLTEVAGRIDPQQAMELLADVSQDNTQWSVVYGMTSGELRVSMGRQYHDWHIFHLVHVRQ
jgi:choloylglycine hydrolase